MFGDDDDDISSANAVRFPVMPSLVSLQQMRNRLHLAYLGKKLMKWTAISTGKELRRLAVTMDETYRTFAEDLHDAFILLARARYFFPDLNKMTLSDLQKAANVMVTTRIKAMAGVKVIRYFVIEDKKPYVHMGISEGGQAIQEAKDAWLELLKRMILMAELRIDFIQVDRVHKNANKKQNVLTKVTIPRILVTIKYILDELEEREREETFRLKRIKQKKNKEKDIKKNKDKNDNKNDDGNNDKKDDGNDDGKDDKKDDRKDYKILRYSSFATIIKEDKNDTEEDKEIEEKNYRKADENGGPKDDMKYEGKNDKNINKIHLCSCCATVIDEDESLKGAKLPKKPSEPKSEPTCGVIPCEIFNHEEKIKDFVSVIAKAIKSTELIKLESLVASSLDRLLDTCNEIKNKLEDYTNPPLCTVCKKNMLDNIVMKNLEPSTLTCQSHATRLVSSALNSIEPACQGTCSLVPSQPHSIRPSSGPELNQVSSVKYHICGKNVQDDNGMVNLESFKIPSQTNVRKTVSLSSDSKKLPCQGTCGLLPSRASSIKPDSGSELNKSDTVKYHMCSINLQDEIATTCDLTAHSGILASDSACQDTCESLSSPTHSIGPYSGPHLNQLSIVKYHLCRKNLQDNDGMMNLEPLKTPSFTRKTVSSVPDSTKLLCQGTCGLVLSSSSPTPSVKPDSGPELNKSDTVKYHMCRINLQDEIAAICEKPSKTPSQTHIICPVVSVSDSTKPACQGTCTLVPSSTPIKPAFGPELNKSGTVKYHLCKINLQDENATMNKELSKIPYQTRTTRSVTSISNSIEPDCQGTCGLVFSGTPINPPSDEEPYKSNTVKHHICNKNLQNEVTLGISSRTIKSLPSANDFVKSSCQGLCKPLHSINPVCKESIRAIEQPVATYDFITENDNQFGYFEKKFKEIIKVTRLQNEDGTISEEKQTITIKTERRNPRKTDDCVISSSDCGSGGVYSGGSGHDGYGRGGRHGIGNDYNDNSGSDHQNYMRQTRSEHTCRKNTMGDPKVRSCMSAENQKKTKCEQVIPGCGNNNNSCYMFTKASRMIIASEPQTKSYMSESLSAISCICCPTNLDSVRGTELISVSADSIIISQSPGTGTHRRSNVQDETKSIGTEAIWRDVCTSTTDLEIIPSKMITNVKSTIVVLNNLINKLKNPASDNKIKDEEDIHELKGNCCNIKLIPKKVKLSYNDSCRDSCNEVVLKGSLLDALKEVYLPQTANRLAFQLVDSTRQGKYNCNICNKLLLSNTSQKTVKTPEEPTCPEYGNKCNESETSFSCKSCSPVPQTYYSWLSRPINKKPSSTPSASSFCAMCQVSQQEFELQSSSRDEQSPNLSYLSCQSAAAGTSDKINKEETEMCCRKGWEKAFDTEHSDDDITHHDTTKTSKMSFDEVSKKRTKLRKKEDRRSMNVSDNPPVPSGHSQKHIYCKIKCYKSKNYDDVDDLSQDLVKATHCKIVNDILECPSKLKRQTKDVGTCTNRSSRYDVRPAKLHLSDKIRRHCACQSDTQVLRNRFLDWLPIKPVQKCKSTNIRNIDF